MSTDIHLTKTKPRPIDTIEKKLSKMELFRQADHTKHTSWQNIVCVLYSVQVSTMSFSHENVCTMEIHDKTMIECGET